jgi:hypothetical protein
VLGAADYVRAIAARLDGRMRMVVIKLRLFECRLRLNTDRPTARRLADWVLREAAELALPAREAEANGLMRLTQNG